MTERRDLSFINPHDTMANLQERAKHLIEGYYNTYVLTADSDLGVITIDEIFVVWFCKALQNWKALVSTHRPDGRYYEVTYDGDKKVTYIDEYHWTQNVEVPDESAWGKPLFERKPNGLFNTAFEANLENVIEQRLG